MTKNDNTDDKYNDTPDGSFRKDCRIDYDPAKLNRAIDDLGIATARVAAGFLRPPPGGIILAADGTKNPFYGRSYHYLAGVYDDPALMTPSGQMAQPAFKRMEGKSVPQFGGTPNGHEWSGLGTMYRDTLEGILLTMRHGRTTPACLEAMLEVAGRTGLSFGGAFFDKYHCGEPLTRVIRNFCDPRHIPVVIPFVRNAVVQQMAADDWNTGAVHPIYEHNKPLFFSVHKRYWDGNTIQPYYLVCFFVKDRKPHGLDPSKGDDDIVGNLDHGYSTVMFYTNIEVPDAEVALWLFEQYRGRWGATETRWKARKGRARSHARSMFIRHLLEAMVWQALNAKNIWRARERREHGIWKEWHPDISGSIYWRPMHGFIERRLYAQPKRVGLNEG